MARGGHPRKAAPSPSTVPLPCHRRADPVPPTRIRRSVYTSLCLHVTQRTHHGRRNPRRGPWEQDAPATVAALWRKGRRGRRGPRPGNPQPTPQQGRGHRPRRAQHCGPVSRPPSPSIAAASPATGGPASIPASATRTWVGGRRRRHHVSLAPRPPPAPPSAGAGPPTSRRAVTARGWEADGEATGIPAPPAGSASLRSSAPPLPAARRSRPPTAVVLPFSF
jgi:hypothetical protein